jgi:hypothetical protein
MTHFKTADGQPLIADSPLYVALFWIFNCLFIRVFGIPFSGISRASNFQPDALEPLVLGTFKRFETLFGTPILVPIFGTFTRFARDALAALYRCLETSNTSHTGAQVKNKTD